MIKKYLLSLMVLSFLISRNIWSFLVRVTSVNVTKFHFLWSAWSILSSVSKCLISLSESPSFWPWFNWPNTCCIVLMVIKKLLIKGIIFWKCNSAVFNIAHSCEQNSGDLIVVAILLIETRNIFGISLLHLMTLFINQIVPASFQFNFQECL